MRKTVIGIALALVVIIAVLLLFGRARPVLFALGESGDPLKAPSFSVFNPFRDRAPERAAEGVLKDLREARFDSAFGGLLLSEEDKQETKQREEAHPLLSWELVGRNDLEDTVRLFYRAERVGTPNATSPLWLSLSRPTTNEGWEPTKLEAWY